MAFAQEGLGVLANRSIGGTVRIPSLRLTEYARLRGHVGVRVRREENLSSYLRHENFRLNLGLSDAGRLNDLLNLSGDVSVIFRGGPEVNGLFVRPFPNQAQALNVKVHPPVGQFRSLPHNADKALEMSEGEYYSFQMKMSLGLSGSLLRETLVQAYNQASVFSHFSANLSYVMSGDFNVEVYRKSGNRVLVRASSLKQRDRSLGVTLGPRFSLDVFSWDAVNDFIGDRLGFDILTLRSNRRVGSIFAVEFQYDLSDEDAKAAYNSLVDPELRLIRAAQLLNPANAGRNVDYVASMTALIFESEQLAAADEGRAQPRVSQPSKAQSHFTERSRSSGLNLLFFSDRGRRTFINQDLLVSQGPGRNSYDHYALLSTFHTREGRDAIAGHEALKEQNFNVLFDSNPNESLRAFRHMNYQLIRREDRLKASELDDVNGLLSIILPATIRDWVDIAPLLERSYAGRAFRMEVDIDVSPDAVVSVLRMSQEDRIRSIHDSFFQYASTYGFGWYGKIPSFERALGQGFRGDFQAAAEVLIAKRDTLLQGTLRRMGEAFGAGERMLLNRASWQIFTGLVVHDVYEDIGGGLLTRLVVDANPGRDIRDLLRIRVTLKSPGLDPVTFPSAGQNQSRVQPPESWNRLVNIRQGSLGRGYDIRYFQD